MKHLKQLTLALAFVLCSVVPLISHGHASAAFNPNLLMDDVVFNDSASMSGAQIDNWLNVNFPNSCISTNHGFAAPDVTGYSPSTSFTYGSDVSAGTIISHAAQVYGLNPEVILTTLEKEEGLVSGSGYAGNPACSNLRYSAAMGYLCTDNVSPHDYSGFELYSLHGTAVTSVSGTCVESSHVVGFSRQVLVAAWQLKFDQQRSEGNIGWNVQIRNYPYGGNVWDNSDDPQTCYSHKMTQGFFQTCSGAPAATFDGLYPIDGSTVHMDTGPTAAFYNYTPHFPGNQNMVTIFTAWFGGTVSAAYYSCHDANNVPGVPTGEHVIGSKLGINHTDNLRLIVPNNTGSHCVEVHTWQNTNYQSWIQHIATNSPAINPVSQRILSADLNGDGIDELYQVNYSGSTSGMIEVHGWDGSNQHWVSHIATNRPGISLADSEVVAADPTGSGHDSLFLVQYRNTASHRIEIHQWSSNFQQWVSHIATNYGEVDPATAQVVVADTNGDGADEFYLVNYAGNSGRIEIHQWSSNFQQWVSHIATVSPAAVHVDGSGNPVSDVIAADTDGNAKDEFYKVDYTGTASGRIEIHQWSSNFQQWVSHIATNQGAY